MNFADQVSEFLLFFFFCSLDTVAILGFVTEFISILNVICGQSMTRFEYVSNALG